MFIVKYRKIFFGISAILVFLSLFSVIYFGLNFGIDFKGGAIMEIAYPSAEDIPLTVELKSEIETLGLGVFIIQDTGGNGIILRTRDLTEEERSRVIDKLSLGGTVEIEEKRFNSIGPVVGEELKRKAWVALLFVILAIISFVAFAFRKLSYLGTEGVSSWKYGIIAIIALIHDIIIPTGIFAYLGSFSVDYQIDILFVTALLAILGFSVNDTIVVFDRVRENLMQAKNTTGKYFEEIVGKSLRQTMARSINTSLTTLIVLGFLYFMGGEVTQKFALVLSIGVIAGTYSSIFLASPLLVVAKNWKKKDK
jgi:preprotein translocase subunit SecF